MHLRTLWLQHFRSYTNQVIQFSPNTTVIVGENARGKTNILEAIHVLATGTSFRAHLTEDMIAWNQPVGRIKGVAQESTNDTHTTELEVVLTNGSVQGQKSAKRKYLVEGVSKRRKDFASYLQTVVFRPEDLSLIDGSPSKRRNYLDTLLCQASKEYRDSHDTYHKALLRRNALLDVLREGNTTRQAFFYWDQLLIKHGQLMAQHRQEFIEFLQRYTELPMQFEVEYDRSVISEERLHKYAVQEVSAGYTLVGPHKEDMFVSISTPNGNKLLQDFGSRGEQRMGVLWLKMAEVAYLKQTLGHAPILLLDDIFSELDQEHQEMVMQLTQHQQTIFTTTPVTLPDNLFNATMLTVDNLNPNQPTS